jgi:glucosamine--fructose-6-phosphate aminotransferase (isomerizing)
MQKGKNTYEEIMTQGHTWKKTLNSTDFFTQEVTQWLRKPWEEVFFIGCGSTYYLSLSIASIWQTITGISTKAIPSSELWQSPNSVISKTPTMLLAISRSGETSETLNAIQVFKEKQGENFASITCNVDSKLALISSKLLVTQYAVEKSIAQTRSFTSMHIMAQYAAYTAAGSMELLDEIITLPICFERLMAKYRSVAKEVGENQDLKHFVFLGSGANYGLACEAMLKMKEMSLSIAEAFHFLEFRHGPKSMVTQDTLVIGLIGDSTRDEEIKVLSEMRVLGATVLALVETPENVEADYIIELDSGISEFPRSTLMIPILQLIAYYRSIIKGLNPDCPKNLEMVVKL